MPPKRRAVQPRRKSRGRTSYLGWVLAMIVILAALGASLVFLFGLFGPSKTPSPTAERTPLTRSLPTEDFGKPVPPPPPAETPVPAPNATSEDLPYEEDHAERILDSARTVDMVIAQTLAELRLGPDRIGGQEEARTGDGPQGFVFQDIVLSLHPKGQQFLNLLRAQLADLVPEASLQNVRKGKDDEEWLIYVDNQPTHHLTIYNGALEAEAPGQTAPAPRPVPPAPKGKPGRVIVVIDDMGMDLPAAQQLAALPFPVVFSVLPYRAHTADVRALARQKHLDIMLHMPCEPLAANMDPGPGTVTTTMPLERVSELFRQALAQVPEAIGLNNHMGSKFTQDDARLEVLFREAHASHLFFLDSLTTPQSHCEAVAKRLNLRILKRAVFLDVVQNPEAVLFQLKTAERLAGRDGVAIAIGHPHKATIEGLKLWAAKRDSNITVSGIADTATRLATR